MEKRPAQRLDKWTIEWIAVRILGSGNSRGKSLEKEGARKEKERWG
jgi:hypothetical protein